MGDIISISTLAGNFSTELELQAYCDKQFQTIKKLTEENEKLNAEIEHLKFVISSSTEILPYEVVKIIVTKEQALLEEQISILQSRSIGKELTLEDTKKLDLLIKNLRIVKENQPPLDGKPKKKFVTNERDLLTVASKEIATDESS